VTLPAATGVCGSISAEPKSVLLATDAATRITIVGQPPADSEDQTFDVYLRRQFRFGNFKIALEPVGMGYQPRAFLSLDATGLKLARVNTRGERTEGTSTSPRSWTWRWDQVLNAQTILVTFTGWGIAPPTRYGVRLDIQSEAFYPVVATHTVDDLVQALEDHGVAVDRKPRRLSWFLTGWK
jgi:hypothetical protein